MKRRRQAFAFFVLLSVVGGLFLAGAPREVLAQDFELIMCPDGNCAFSDLITLAQRLINALIMISTFLATGAFAYAGIILLTSGGSEEKKNRAKDIFKKVLIGYLWILGAWLLIYTITSVLLKPGYSLLGAP